MTKAIVPKELPGLPEGCSAWARSTKRPGGVFHAHSFGLTACRSILLDRHRSEDARHLGDMQYYGLCPKCVAKIKANA